MELKDFISTTLVQIVKGVEEASEDLLDSDAIVNPINVNPDRTENILIYGYYNPDAQIYSRPVQKIEFDIAVIVEQGKETKGSFGIQVGSIGIGTQGRSESGNSSVSRIQFTIPMLLPSGELVNTN